MRVALNAVKRRSLQLFRNAFSNGLILVRKAGAKTETTWTLSGFERHCSTSAPRKPNVIMGAVIPENVKRLINEVITAPTTRLNENETQRLCDEYNASDFDRKLLFTKHIINDYNVNTEIVESAIDAYKANKQNGGPFVVKAIEKLRQSLTPRYMILFNKIARLENGVKFLVDLRADISNAINQADLDENTLRSLRSFSEHLKNLLSLWFSVGFLRLERITWDTSCDTMQKISEYEAVHPVRNWTDLKRRVGPYRRCYAFFHSCVPREPLVILHVALTKEISSTIKDIVRFDPHFSEQSTGGSLFLSEDSSKINAAIFYSISSPQKGLNGIELGTRMIREVVRKIKAELPHVNIFSSLSPIPGFRDYILAEIQASIKDSSKKVENFARSQELEALSNYLLDKENHNSNVWSQLFVQIKSGCFVHDSKLCDLLYTPLMRKCAHYLFVEKRRGFALNSVANFHLRNGAVMWRLNWKADITPRGLSNSCGIMINYRYFIDELDKNSVEYLERREVQASELFMQHLRPHRYVEN